MSLLKKHKGPFHKCENCENINKRERELTKNGKKEKCFLSKGNNPGC